jgi:hypothetical protein
MDFFSGSEMVPAMAVAPRATDGLKLRKKTSVILSLSKDQLPRNGRHWRRKLASLMVFPEIRSLGEPILRHGLRVSAIILHPFCRAPQAQPAHEPAKGSWRFRQRIASCALRAPGRQVVRATQTNLPCLFHVFLFSCFPVTKSRHLQVKGPKGFESQDDGFFHEQVSRAKVALTASALSTIEATVIDRRYRGIEAPSS